ncbi:MAG TPA: hypothetical protein VHB79_04430 [Polyangiaceae bacterium]|nr:hypothetical protein [Polyangiaceae bacterium]
MTEAANTEFPGLFRHPSRAAWGVGVLAGERDGKRTYLFESGEERTMGSGAHDMMHRIAPLDAEQQSTLARLTALVARRHGLPDASKATGVVLLEQVAVLRRAFPQGLLDPAWPSEQRAAQARETLVPQAQKSFALGVIDAQLKAQQLDALWTSATQVLLASGWPPPDQLQPAPAAGLASLAGALRELLYGSATIEQRVDRFSVAFETAFRHPPRWETTTGLLALVSPDRHVLVDLPSFRKQLKLLGSKGPLPQSPNGASYVRCLNAARIVASKLTEQGEVPRDLLDVHDFIRFTLKATPPARRAKAAPKAPKPKAPKKKNRAEEAEDTDESSE